MSSSYTLLNSILDFYQYLRNTNLMNFKSTFLLIASLFLVCNLFSQTDPLEGYELAPTLYAPLPGTNIVPIGEEMHIEILARDFAGVKSEENKQLKSKENGCGNIGFDPVAVTLCETTGSFTVNYTGFTPEARRAFQYAVDIWSRVLDFDVPIVIDADFSPLGPGVLGAAGPTFVNRDGPAYPVPGTWYPIALSNQFDGVDVVAGSAHIGASFSSEFTNWYFGLDGCPPAGDFDFVTVVLHEIGHGLGFTSFRRFCAAGDPCPIFFGSPTFPFNVGCLGFLGFPYIFDTFLANPSAGLGSGTNCFVENGAFTNGELVFTGPETTSCIGRNAPLYTPEEYRPGSSVAHFDEASFPGVDPDGLMTPFVGRGQAIHDPGCALALFRDLGYDTVDSVPECEVVPTMGEWGLMSLGLILLILGVVTIKSRKVVFG